VCRKSYINPAVFEGWRSGAIHKASGGNLGTVSPRKAEMLVLSFLRRS
jgi:DNA topoisomerase IB